MNKKKDTYLEEESLFTLLSQNNFIVPEIQRDYVWGENEKVIKGFLESVKSEIGVPCPQYKAPTTENKINVGFLYSYKPDYVEIEQDRFLDENLIDGQQRVTTLFLLLFVCSLKENRNNEFLTLIRFEPKLKMCFDFRVRDLTKRFLLELVEKVTNTEQLKEIDKQTWFLKDYQNDVSIKSMQKALGYIQDVFSDNTRCYNYLINYVVFWHFKTEATSQGEELYITMNARGEELAGNEVTKATLKVNSELCKCGKKWEEWQQFFWKNRDKKDEIQSADKGFNSFLGCIAGLESYLNYDKLDAAEKNIEKLLTFGKVKEYFEAFKLLIDKKQGFKSKYSYSNWVDKCLEEIWNIFNKNETDWLVDYGNDNKSTERNKMIFIWSWLYYIKKAKNVIEESELYRVLRFFYIRYNNFNRSVPTLKDTIDKILEKGIWEFSNNEIDNEDENHKEETTKSKFLQSKANEPDLLQFEELIWEIEDHPLNLDGGGVGAINCSHLVNFANRPSVEDLTKIKNKFYKLFPITKGKEIDNINYKKLINILLFYGIFWERRSPWSYWNYYFGNWKKIIRDINTKRDINAKNRVFESFFNDFKIKALKEIYVTGK